MGAVDIGIVNPWGPKEKISLVFQLGQEGPDGSRYIVGKHYTKSLNEKSNFRGDLQRWGNHKFKPVELEEGFDLESLIGISALVYISHNETEKRTYANVNNIMPPERGKSVLVYNSTQRTVYPGYRAGWQYGARGVC